MSFRRWLIFPAFLVILMAGTRAQSQPSKTLSITLTQPLTDTGLQVVQGQLITISASGMMNWFTGSCDNECISTPAGSSCPYTGFYAQGLPCWSLIGQIGDGAPFIVGSSLRNFSAPNSGELYLGVNDNNYPDNTGNWTAMITLPTPTPAKIFFDGMDVTTKSQPVSIGQRIGLTASLPGFATRDGDSFGR